MAEYLTRCPACRTKFDLTEEQMNARAGRVRCGECQEIFQANENLIGEPAKEEEHAEVSQRGSTTNDTSNMASIDDSSLDDLFNEPLISDPKGDNPEIDLDEEFSLDDEITMEFDQLTGEFDATINPSSSEHKISREPQSEEDWLDSLLEDDQPTTHTESILNDRDLSGFLEGIGANTAQFSAVQHDDGMTHDMSLGPVKDRLKDLEKRQTRRQPAVAKQVASGLLWGILSVVALLTLAAQLVYFKFNDLAAHPTMGPMLQSICQDFGCNVPIANADMVTINELEWAASSEGTEVSFTVGNASGEQMLLPSLKVELYNDDALIGGNVLTPLQYLSVDYSHLPSQQPIDGYFVIPSSPEAFDSVQITPLY